MKIEITSKDLKLYLKYENSKKLCKILKEKVKDAEKLTKDLENKIEKKEIQK